MMPKFPELARFELSEQAARRLAFAYTLFLLTFETYVVQANNANMFVKVFNSESGLLVLAALLFAAGSLYLAYRFFFLALSSPWKYKSVYVSILAASLVVEYSYQKALGRFSDVLDIELAFATTFEQKTASIAAYFGFASFFPILAFLIILILTKTVAKRGFRDLIAANTLIVAVLFAGSALSLSSFPTVSTIAFYRTNVAFVLSGPIMQGEWGSYFTGFGLKRHPVPSPGLPDGYSPDNNIIFVVDESVRGDHFSLNGYGRPTTPFLDDLHKKGILHNWGIAAAASTGSHTSYNTIVTGLTPDDFPEAGQLKLKTTPTIFQYAKAMGYTTWFFDGQMDFFWSGIKDDRRFIDNWIAVNALKGPAVSKDWQIDAEIARRVNEIVGESKGNFVFVFKHGSHVPYHLNFPPEEGPWQPSYANANVFDIPGPEELDAVANAYDNSIRYNVNSFFKHLIDDYDRIPNNTVILYTGDHGQTLFANGKASHSGYTREEAMVPLLIIGDLKANVDTSYKASHNNLYPTVLDLINYPMEMRERKLPLSLLTAKSADSRPRFFNPAYGPKHAFD